MKWLLLILLLIAVVVAVALWRRTQMTSGTPAGADPASLATGQTLVPPPVPSAAGVPPVFDPLVPVIPVDPIEPHEVVLGVEGSARGRPGETQDPEQAVNDKALDEDENKPDLDVEPPPTDGR